MRRVAAPLAAVLCGLAVGACGGGAEPGAPQGATLVLDFQANAVHSGLYAAKARGYFEDEGLDLDIREPSSSADGAKLLETGSAEFAILDINDFGIARERGFNIVAIAAIAQRPLASVIAADRNEVRTPADLAGRTVGVTGVPSDDAVLDTVLAAGGLAPGAVERQTIGFQSVPLLAAGQLDAATAFWNAEGVGLRQRGVPTREFRVDEFGAPRYPELVVAVPGDAIPSVARQAGEAVSRSLPCVFMRGLERGYGVLADDPDAALEGLLEAVPAASPDAQSAQLAALVAANAFTPPPARGPASALEDAGVTSAALSLRAGPAWLGWAASRRIVEAPGGSKAAARIAAGFRSDVSRSCGGGSPEAPAG
ncbi:MAG TPA: ABC transporter substrate-binding protein [Solirubrobacterales bacterium]|jgi:NitT/TauT family transport system substrate-binding protein/putative hydroxymethylpyrimidine transport system substrate-binding protein|nr:ABC transporter substrate-binding protein [Solirubrobacterales bacterium]